MAKYIPLDALVAEIERRFDEYSSSILKHYDACKEAKAQELGKILTIIDTIEVKEIGVDLGDPKGDKSAKYIIDTKNLEVKEVGLPNFEQEVKDFCYDFDDRKEAWYKMTPHDQNLMVSPTFANFAMQLAKHFFELGMRVSNPITAEDRGTAEEIIINLKRVEQDYSINLTKEMEWLRNQVKKGE